MKIDKAIEILTEDIEKDTFFLPAETMDAMKLGIEALKFYAELKQTRGITIAFLLAGETEA